MAADLSFVSTRPLRCFLREMIPLSRRVVSFDNCFIASSFSSSDNPLVRGSYPGLGVSAQRHGKVSQMHRSSLTFWWICGQARMVRNGNGAQKCAKIDGREDKRSFNVPFQGEYRSGSPGARSSRRRFQPHCARCLLLPDGGSWTLTGRRW